MAYRDLTEAQLNLHLLGEYCYNYSLFFPSGGSQWEKSEHKFALKILSVFTRRNKLLIT